MIPSQRRSPENSSTPSTPSSAPRAEYDPHTPWQHQGNCTETNMKANPEFAGMDHHPEVFFPQRIQGGQCAPAKRICGTGEGACPVKVECLKFGLKEPFGVWGGLSEKERREAHRLVKAGWSYERIIRHFEAVTPKRRRKSSVLAPVIPIRPSSDDVALRVAEDILAEVIDIPIAEDRGMDGVVVQIKDADVVPMVFPQQRRPADDLVARRRNGLA